MKKSASNPLDAQLIWHPYAAQPCVPPAYEVESAAGIYIQLSDGRRLIDGMASWWSVIHGYRHPVLDRAIQEQSKRMAHIMFGGLTHQPAIQLAERLVNISPLSSSVVFFADSGSVAVEVALKMAVQYHQAQGRNKTQMVALRGAYHGDTLGAMSVCDPVNGMHRLYQNYLPKQWFVPRPISRFGQPLQDQDIAAVQSLLQKNHHQIAALILEPIVQGAGGMYFYSAEYLKQIRQLCDQYDIVLIADEIATGFGRTGRLFACEWAGIEPDILCLGKALTGGYMSLAAVLCQTRISQTISAAPPYALMHGPTFMANPLACSVSLASLDLLLNQDWSAQIQRIESGLKKGLAPAAQYEQVQEVRVLGAIGVVELKQAVNMQKIQPALVEAGIWLRPFGRLIYMMPPYIIDDQALDELCQKTLAVLYESD